MRKIVQCNIIFLAAALGLGGHAGPLRAEHHEPTASANWHPVDASTGQIADVESLQALAEAFPNSASVRLRLLNAYIAAGQSAQALTLAEGLSAEGYVFSPGARDYLQGLTTTGTIPTWLSNNSIAGEAIIASEVVATLPTEAQLPESVSVAADNTFAVTTVISRELWVGRDGTWEATPIAGEGNLSGIIVDDSGIILASANLGMVSDEAMPFAGLIAIENGLDPVFIEAPEGVQLSDLAFWRDQVLYASDPLGGGVYKSESLLDPLHTLVSPGTFRSPQGIAPSLDGQRIYVSDYRYGLAIVDSETGEVSRLAADAPMLLDGIDGLWLHDGELIAVQNGLSPMRIVALRLSEDGDRITSMRVLERANPEWTEPLGGAIHDDALYYIGNGSWDLFEEGGTLREGAELRATHVRRLELSQNPTD